MGVILTKCLKESNQPLPHANDKLPEPADKQHTEEQTNANERPEKKIVEIKKRENKNEEKEKDEKTETERERQRAREALDINKGAEGAKVKVKDFSIIDHFLSKHKYKPEVATDKDKPKVVTAENWKDRHENPMMEWRHVSVTDEAFVTLATNDSYALGALVLGNSLLRVNTSKSLVCMITPGVSQGVRQQLNNVFDQVPVVDVLDSRDESNLRLAQRPDLGITFTKLHCWKLTQFTKAVFMDADCLVLQNIDDLFEREELSAAADIGWPDMFNTGVFVFRPNNDTYEALINMALTEGSFDGGDQGLLNRYFSDWPTKDISKHLPFIYNMSANVTYTYLPAYKQFGGNVKVVHFLGHVKPWHHSFNVSSGRVESYPGDFHSIEHLQLWWVLFMAAVQPQLEPQYGSFSSGIATLSLPSPAAAMVQRDEGQWQRDWEQGRIDYLGADSFDNILKKLQDTIGDDDKAKK